MIYIAGTFGFFEETDVFPIMKVFDISDSISMLSSDKRIVVFSGVDVCF